MNAQQRVEHLNRLERLKLSQLDRDSVVDEAKWPDSGADAEPLP